jgi:hypothetical protein
MGCSRAIVSSSTRTYYSLDHACHACAAPRLRAIDSLVHAAFGLTCAAAFVVGFLQAAPILRALIT